MLRLAFDFIITWRETRTRPNAYFNDVKYFREVFKKYYKISPSGYSKGEMKEEPTKP